MALRGEFQPDIVTQEQLRELEVAQRAEWLAGQRAHQLSARIKSAIAHGASVEPGALGFDGELEMVRSKKQHA